MYNKSPATGGVKNLTPRRQAWRGALIMKLKIDNQKVRKTKTPTERPSLFDPLFHIFVITYYSCS